MINTQDFMCVNIICGCVGGYVLIFYIYIFYLFAYTDVMYNGLTVVNIKFYQTSKTIPIKIFSKHQRFVIINIVFSKLCMDVFVLAF